ncbi:(2Fe-2S)-binding protein [Novosphingobium panipatense]|uniref:(2Fe-2S)-binding protein n=1 Tax=Novosphingobium panipatense TaxID=428991 RepID=UPI0039A2B86D
MQRVEQGVTRPAPVAVELDGAQVLAHPGETVAVAVLSAMHSGAPRFRDDRSGQARGMFCNMGTCSECTVWIAREGAPWRRLRACLVPVEAGLRIRTERSEA